MTGGATIASEHTFEASWKQPEDVDRYLRENCEGLVLNLCSGESPLGDVQVDADVDRDPDLLANMRHLPFPDATFDTVLFDPPWKLGYYQRMTPFFEAVRTTRPDGRIFFNAKWLGESDMTKLEDVVVRADDRWANVSVITTHRKQPGQQELTEAQPP